jgi:hypothetical protein
MKLCVRYATHIFLLAAVCVLSTSRLQASIIDGLAKYAKDPVSGVISDAKKVASDLISQGENAGNGMMTHGGMELEALTQSAINGLGSDLNKTVGDLSVGEQQVILSLVSLQDQVKQLGDTAYDLKDTTVVDLTAWQSGWVFAHTPNFFVQSIRGTGFLPQPGDYHITVTAYGFGESSDSSAEITGTLNGAPVQFSEVDQTSQRGKAIIAIPNAAIAPLFSSDKLTVATLTLNVKLSRKKFLHTQINNYSFPVHLLLYPSKVAIINVKITEPSFGWVAIGDVDSPPVYSDDRDGCKYCDTKCTSKKNTTIPVAGVHAPPVVGDQKITGATLDCRSANLCAFTVRYTYHIVENGGRVNASWESCTHTALYYVHAAVQQYEQTGTTETAKTVDLDINNPQVVTLPDQTSLIVVNVTSFTKQQYSLVYPQKDPHSIVTLTWQPHTHNFVLTAIPPA